MEFSILYVITALSALIVKAVVNHMREKHENLPNMRKDAANQNSIL